MNLDRNPPAFRALRLQAGVSQREVADAIGCSIACVCKFELHCLGIGLEKAKAAADWLTKRAA